MDLQLKDKVVVVTGSSRGIGLATAKAFAAEGCRLMLSARSADALRDAEAALRASGATVAGEVADVTQPDDAARLVQAAVAAFGGVDILVNNVGGGGGGRTIADSTDEDWHTTLEINLLQTVRMMRLALPHMSGRAAPQWSTCRRSQAGRRNSPAPASTARPRQRSSSMPNAGLWSSCRTAYG